MAETMFGYSPAGLYGYTHLTGGYAGGQAEYVRVPFADVGPMKVENDLPDDPLVMLTDVFPTAYMAAENANIQPGDIVAVWGCGPVGLLTIACAYLLGAERVIAMDRVPERLEMAERQAGAETVRDDVDVVEVLREKTGGRGPDACIDAVGMEAHSEGLGHVYDKVKQTLKLQTDRPHVLREAIQACRKGGTVSVPGVYGGFIDKMPIGAVMNKGLTIRSGQTHVPRYLKTLLGLIGEGKIDPSFIVTHRLPLEEAPEAYRTFRDKKNGCIKVVLKPQEQSAVSSQQPAVSTT
jgi:threonine dehydrogenase-like Zn-dependent dehydrogenase